jgi:hypothetical protein
MVMPDNPAYHIPYIVLLLLLEKQIMNNEHGPWNMIDLCEMRNVKSEI